MTEAHAVFAPSSFGGAAAGPLYLRLKTLIQSAIHDGRLRANDALDGAILLAGGRCVPAEAAALKEARS